jgi:hypothetical protein
VALAALEVPAALALPVQMARKEGTRNEQRIDAGTAH